jgi:hypothetical protein
MFIRSIYKLPLLQCRPNCKLRRELIGRVKDDIISDVPVDAEAPVVTSRISISAGAQSFVGAHRGRVCVRVFIGVSVRACCERLRCTV